MYLLKGDKLYGYQDRVYKSVDIIDGITIFNGLETQNDARGGQLLTHKEVYCKFHINPTAPQLGKSYNFPRKEDVVEEPKVTPKSRGSNK